MVLELFSNIKNDCMIHGNRMVQMKADEAHQKKKSYVTFHYFAIHPLYSSRILLFFLSLSLSLSLFLSNMFSYESTLSRWHTNTNIRPFFVFGNMSLTTKKTMTNFLMTHFDVRFLVLQRN